jgi:hypothetical protein
MDACLAIRACGGSGCLCISLRPGSSLSPDIRAPRQSSHGGLRGQRRLEIGRYDAAHIYTGFR